MDTPTTTTTQNTTTTTTTTTNTNNTEVPVQDIYTIIGAFFTIFNTIFIAVLVLFVMYYIFYNNNSLSLLQIVLLLTLFIWGYLYQKFTINKSFKREYDLKLQQVKNNQ